MRDWVVLFEIWLPENDVDFRRHLERKEEFDFYAIS